MIELFFVACLATAPTECRDHSLVYADITPQACAMGAQPELAKWAANHPKHRIKRWLCRTVNFAEREA